MRCRPCINGRHSTCSETVNRGTTDHPREDACSCGCRKKRKAPAREMRGTVRRWAKDRDGHRCQANIAGVCRGTADHVHHLRQRSLGGDDELGNLLTVCWACHSYLHETMPLAEAKAAGLLR